MSKRGDFPIKAEINDLKDEVASSWKSCKFRGKRQDAALFFVVFLAYLALHILFNRHNLPAYDAYTYISFAEHYAENWFKTIISSQAHGLQIASYPPLLFQIMALISFIPLLEMTQVYVLTASAAAAGISLSIYYLLNELFESKEQISRLAAVFIAFSPGLLKSVLVYGQITSVVGLSLGFTSILFFYRTIKNKEDQGIFFLIFIILTAYTHHFSLLITGLVLSIIALVHFNDTVANLDKLALLGLISGLTVFIGLSATIREILFGFSQGNIFHGSRNPLQSVKIFNQYITSTYGASILGLLLVIKKRLNMPSIRLATSIFLVIGLGLTTKLPEILFGDFSKILVYDRFSLVSSLLLSGLVGVYITEKSFKNDLIGFDFKKIALGVFILLGVITCLWANNIHLGSYTGYGTSNPAQTSTATQFLNSEASSDYLYVTYNHREPIGEIRRNTEVPTLDTAYHPGREIEEFRSFEKLDRLPRHKFKKVVQEADNLSLKYILDFNGDLGPIINQSEWEKRDLENDVKVWINKDVPEYNAETGSTHIIFGIVPILSLLVSVAAVYSHRIKQKCEDFVELSTIKIRQKSTEVIDKKFYLVTVSLLVLLSALPSLLTQGLPSGIDTPSYLFKAEQMSSMIQEHGQLYYWTNMWYNGYPFLSTYSPLALHAINFIENAVNNLTLSYNLIRLLAASMTAGAVYNLSKNISKDHKVSTIAATLAIFSYPIYSNLYTVGRFPSALALPLYLFLIDLIIRKDTFSKKLTRSNIYLGIGCAILFLTHSMMAYLFIFTAIIFAAVYWQRVRTSGIQPLIATAAIPGIVCIPHISKLIQHIGILETSWYVTSRQFSIQEQFLLSFNITPPVYIGLVYGTLLIYGLLKYFKTDNKFLKFSVLNFSFFYTVFWARNFKVASLFLPFARKFDQSEFEILFAVFGVFIAAYGFNYILKEKITDTINLNKILLTLAVVGVTVVNMSPMLTQSSNWTPQFSGEIEEAPIENDYRSIGTGMRVWDSYLLKKAEIANTFGWFNQANPNKQFTETLQETGGRWYAGKLEFDKYNSTVRKNLMEISNTKYIIAATGEWIKPSIKQQVVGNEKIYHHLDEKLVEDISKDDDFNRIHSAEHLEVYELEIDMSYCQEIDPVWIQDNYDEKSLEFFQTSDALPEFPVEGKPRDLENGDVEVSCDKEDPYTISVDANGTGWVLVKESYYPFWERSDGGKIIDGYGFQIIHVDGEKDLELEYQPRNISTLSPDDIRSFTGTIFS